jgi:hypothetical protein
MTSIVLVESIVEECTDTPSGCRLLPNISILLPARCRQ